MRRKNMKEEQPVCYGAEEGEEGCVPIPPGTTVYGVNDGQNPRGIIYGVNDDDPDAQADADLAWRQHNWDFGVGREGQAKFRDGKRW
jgi:hypothetical protein